MNTTIAKETTMFERTVQSLEKSIAEARHISESFRNKVGRLENSPLEYEMNVEKMCAPSVQAPDTLIYKLNNLIGDLEGINYRNMEILKHLDTLI
jgi:hypothetical protein